MAVTDVAKRQGQALTDSDALREQRSEDPLEAALEQLRELIKQYYVTEPKLAGAKFDPSIVAKYHLVPLAFKGFRAMLVQKRAQKVQKTKKGGKKGSMSTGTRMQVPVMLNLRNV